MTCQVYSIINGSILMRKGRPIYKQQARTLEPRVAQCYTGINDIGPSLFDTTIFLELRCPGWHLVIWDNFSSTSEMFTQLCSQDVMMLTLKALKCVFFISRHQFEIVINVLVRSFRFIWIPMLCVYVHYKYVIFFSAGINFRRQIGTLISRSSRWKG